MNSVSYYAVVDARGSKFDMAEVKYPESDSKHKHSKGRSSWYSLLTTTTSSSRAVIERGAVSDDTEDVDERR